MKHLTPKIVTSAMVKGSARNYAYDDAGYVVSDGKRTYQWASFGQLRQLDYLAAPDLMDFSGNLVHAASRVTSTFDFDSGGNRARQTKERIAANDSRKIEFTLYLGSYEREIHQTKANGTAPAVLAKTVHRHSLGGGVIYTRTTGGSDPGVKLMAVLADHLGSTDVIVTGKWNTSTAAFANITTERQSFDAWGERRAADTQVNYRATDGDAFRTSAQEHHRGYTGHEQLDDSGLIHMNGRIYDPELGRFLSPDPYVQIPEYSQNFNRYSYVLNNPLNATDPSGFSFLSKFFSKVGSWIKENWRTIVVIVAAVVVTVLTAGIAGSVAYSAAYSLAASGVAVGTAAAAGAAAGFAVAGAIVGAITGGLSAALNGGDLGDILRGAFVQGLSGALTGPLHMVGGLANIVGHGIVGGATNVAMGGKFGDGFISAAAGAATAVSGLTSPGPQIGQSLGLVGRTAIASAVGGTASVIGGGKFANGAFTAAFQHLVNAEGEAIRKTLKRVSVSVSKQLTVIDTSDLKNLEAGDYYGRKLDASAPGQRYFGECVSLVKCLGDIGATSTWSAGHLVAGLDPQLGPSNLLKGTLIATFNNSGNFSGHAAIFHSFTTIKGINGIIMYDQWNGKAPGYRFVRYNNGEGYISNDASRFKILLTPKQ
jgi:RHS repeat-associated protein